MLFLNPNEFEGCESRLRIFGSNFAYNPYKNGNSPEIVFRLEGENLGWVFDNESNRDKAIEKIDKMCKHPEPLQQIADNLDNIESSL